MTWHIEADIICFAFTLVLILDYRASFDKNHLRDKLFLCCLIGALLVSVFELTSSLATDFCAAPALFHILNIGYYTGLVLVIILWYCYTSCLVFEKEHKRIMFSLRLGVIIYLIYIAFVVSNVWTGLLYTYDAMGNYARGPWFFVPVVVFALYTLSIVLLVVVFGSRMREQKFKKYLILLPILIAVGIVLQLSITGWLMILPAYTLALLTAYLVIQNQRNMSLMHKLISAADTDQMTGILNHAAAERRTDKLMLSNPDAMCGLIIIDLDDLKGINDTLGHPAGDTAICMTARILEYCCRSTDVVARIGGDEFAVFLPDIKEENSLAMIVEKVLERFEGLDASQSLEFSVPVRCSAGAASGICRLTDRETLYKQADTALYHAKRKGKHCYCIYTPDMEITAGDTNIRRD